MRAGQDSVNLDASAENAAHLCLPSTRFSLAMAEKPYGVNGVLDGETYYVQAGV